MSGTLDVVRRGWRASPELRHGVVRAVALALVAASGRIAIPVLVQQMLDRGLAPDSPDSVLWTVTAIGVVGVVITALAAVAARTRLAACGEATLYGLRVRAFRHIHRLSLATQTEERRGALVSRVTSDVETMSQFLTWGGVAWLVNTATMTAVVVAMTVYEWRLTIVAVTVVIPMVLVLKSVQRLMMDAYAQVRDRTAQMSAAVTESVMGTPVIRAYGAERHVVRRVDTTTDATAEAGIRAGTIGAFLFPTGDVFAALTVAAVTAAGVALGPASGLTAGRLVAFVFLVLLFLEPVAEFTEIVDQTQLAVAGWRRVLDVIDMPVEIAEPQPGVDLPHGPPEIAVEHLSFSYSGERDDVVLDDVSFTVPAGAKVALVGATGSGKTTLAKLLTRLADPTAGRITIAGIDLRDVSFPSLRSSLVLVPQEGFLFDTDVLENVRFGRPDATEEEVRLAFVELGLADWLDGLPHGLATPVGQRGEHLSVGERQLVSLARAYLANPSCLLLDEATSAVDPATEVRLSRAVESLARGRTSITIAHRLSTAERADRIVVLDQGRLVGAGTHAALLAAGGVYAELFERWSAGIDVEETASRR